MSIGRNINRLRVQKGLSQDVLAEIMEVSRQSVSKWENDAALPELDKLVKLSELFGVTLDELILDRKPDIPAVPENPPVSRSTETEPVSPVPAAVERQGLAVRQIVGSVLLCFAGLTFLLITLYFGLLVGFTAAVLPGLCGLLCLVCRKRPGLWCAWTVFAAVTLYLQIVNGVNWLTLLSAMVNGLLWKDTTAGLFSPAVLAVSGLELLLTAGLTVWTCRAFRELRVARTRRNLLLLIAGWLVCLPGFYLLSMLLDRVLLDQKMRLFLGCLTVSWNALRLAAFVTAAVFTAAFVRGENAQ